LKTYLAISCTLWMILIPGAQAQSSAPLRQIQTIAMPNVEGYFDHPAADIKGQRLFVPGGVPKDNRNCGLGRRQEADSGAVVGDIPDTTGAHGVAVAPDFGVGFTSNVVPGSIVILVVGK